MLKAQDVCLVLQKDKLHDVPQERQPGASHEWCRTQERAEVKAHHCTEPRHSSVGFSCLGVWGAWYV